MNRSLVGMLAAVAVVVSLASTSVARAQWVTYRPVTPVVSFYAPAPTAVVAPAPTVAWFAPAPVTYAVATPVIAEPTVVAAPAVPVVTYFRPPVVAVQPVAQVRTRFRPILGGTVSRVRYTYMPVVF